MKTKEPIVEEVAKKKTARRKGPGQLEPRNLRDPDHGTRTRKSDRPEFTDADRAENEGMSPEANAVDESETMASTGNSGSNFHDIVAGTATGLGIDRGVSTGTGGLAAGEDLDPVAEGDYWRENFRRRPYYEAGTPYEDYEPGYRFGWENVEGLDFGGKGFADVESELRRTWDSGRGEGSRPWEEISPYVRDAWERARGKAEGDD